MDGVDKMGGVDVMMAERVSFPAGALANTNTNSPLGPMTIPTEETTVAVTVSCPWADLPSSAGGRVTRLFCWALAVRHNVSDKHIKMAAWKSLLAKLSQVMILRFSRPVTFALGGEFSHRSNR